MNRLVSSPFRYQASLPSSSAPAVDRAQAVDLMVTSPRGRMPPSVNPFSARCSFPELHPQFACSHARGPASRRRARADVVVVIARPCSPSRRGMPLSSMARPRSSNHRIRAAAAVTAIGHQHHRDHDPALSTLLRYAAEPKRVATGKPRTPPCPAASDPILSDICCIRSPTAMSSGRRWWRRPVASSAMQNFHADARQYSFYTHGGGGSPSLPARSAIALGRAAAVPSPDRQRLAMYSIQAAVDRSPTQAAADGRSSSTIPGYARCARSPGDAGAHVPGLELPTFVSSKLAQGMGCDPCG